MGRHPFEELHRLWRNPSAADPNFLEVLWKRAHEGAGPVLECGSGLTTLVLSVACHRTGRELVTLEHDAHGSTTNARRLRVAGAPSSPIRLRPLAAFEGYQWYSIGADDRMRFSLVICDGPPKATRGGRYGLFPTMPGCLADATIVLDDAFRADEREILERWQDEYGVHFPFVEDGQNKPFAIASAA